MIALAKIAEYEPQLAYSASCPVDGNLSVVTQKQNSDIVAPEYLSFAVNMYFLM